MVRKMGIEASDFSERIESEKANILCGQASVNLSLYFQIYNTS